jgi:hypothetical protein
MQYSANQKFLQLKSMPTTKYRKGTSVQKNSKCKSSTTYICQTSPKGQRKLHESSHSGTKSSTGLNELISTINLAWVLCQRNEVLKSRWRKINPIPLTQKHTKLAPLEQRRWQTAVLSSFCLTIRNLYEHL